MDAIEAVVLALRFVDGLRDAGASIDTQAEAVIEHLSRNGYIVRARVAGEGTRPRRMTSGAGALTAAKLRAERDALGLSRAKLADMAGIGRNTLRDFETGSSVPQQKTLKALTAALQKAAQPSKKSDPSSLPSLDSIRPMRQRLGVTIKSLAAKAGVSSADLKNIESGRAPVDPLTHITLVDELAGCLRDNA